MRKILSNNSRGSDRDPLLLATKLQSDEHINSLRNRRAKKSQNRLGRFYQRQNAHIQALLKSMDDHIYEAGQEEEGNRMAVKIAVMASLVGNMCGLIYFIRSSL